MWLFCADQMKNSGSRGKGDNLDHFSAIGSLVIWNSWSCEKQIAYNCRIPSGLERRQKMVDSRLIEHHYFNQKVALWEAGVRSAFVWSSPLFHISIFSDPSYFPRSFIIPWAFWSSLCACSVKLLSRVWLFVAPWTVAHQAPLSMGIL